jgi:uracil-DNA glycosylase
LPPQNKPDLIEVRECNKYLAAELAPMPKGAAILALGIIAHQAVLMAVGVKPSKLAFRHGALHELPNGLALFDSYHCSRYNTQTRRLTPAMFEAVFADISSYLKPIT